MAAERLRADVVILVYLLSVELNKNSEELKHFFKKRVVSSSRNTEVYRHL